MPDGLRIRILIVDDHPVVRAGLTSMLSTYPELEVVGSASGGEQALAMLEKCKADIILLDLRMPKVNGVDVLVALKRLSSRPRVIVLTSFEGDEDIYQSMKAGAHGYLLKASPEEDMIEAIHSVHAGQRYLPRQIASRLADRMLKFDLTPKESGILELIADGLTDEQVARKVGMSTSAVWNHVNRIIEHLESFEATAPAVPERGIEARKITIADVARMAGVSTATVSRVLNNSGSHSRETRDAVMKVVREYDFQLNNAAAALALMRGQSHQ
jgi:DNA-binding NarL/FixJ family response regulator